MNQPKCPFPGCNSTNLSATEMNGVHIVICEHGHVNTADVSIKIKKMIENAVNEAIAFTQQHVSALQNQIGVLKNEIEKLKTKDTCKDDPNRKTLLED